MAIQRIRLVLLLLFAVGTASALPAVRPPDFRRIFRKMDVLIAMRDGIRLHTEIYVPRHASGPLPILLQRTPYGVEDDAHGYAKDLRLYPTLIADGYIFVFQDIRGRFKSGGTFVMNRPPRDASDAKATDESTDTWDTIAWLVRHVPGNNGRVGIFGISYGGWLSTMALLDPHPALRAVSEQASPADLYLGDDFYHNGAFRLSYGFEYATMMETSKTNFFFHFDRYDTYSWYLGLGPLANVNAKYLHGQIPAWNDFAHHPDYDAFWQKQAVWPWLRRTSIPVLNVAGWWDQEDFYGPLKIYRTLRTLGSQHNYLVVGPWNHGGWAEGPGRTLGPLDFGSDTGVYFRDKLEAPWFAYWLKDKGTLPFGQAMTFQTGSDRWVAYDQWPPKNAREKKLYLRAQGSLSFDPPPAREASPWDRYLSDPAHPVPYRPRPVRPTYPGPEWPVWLLQDQRFVDNRPDVATWETAPLDHDVTVSGDIVAHLYAATTGSDSDWVVKLIDVYPETYAPKPKLGGYELGGYELIVADDVFRGRFHNSYVHPQPLVPNQVTAYTIDLHDNNHCFRKGHRIMVQVQSTWFPLIDRNPQRYVKNIFEAKPSDFRTATQTVYRSPQYPSNIELPVVSGAAQP